MINLFPALAYVLISSFTPGPSNISTASLAILLGYKNTLKYQLGLAFGVFLLMLVSGLFSAILLNIFPAFEPILRYVGAGYILYLAYGILKATYTFTENSVQAFGPVNGLTLQILNPKLIVYAFTLFSGFLASLARDILPVTLVSLVLAAISFCATSVWALFGSVIKTYLHYPRVRLATNILLSISLVYAAISLIGIL